MEGGADKRRLKLLLQDGTNGLSLRLYTEN
jgi:hypothetical protein